MQDSPGREDHSLLADIVLLKTVDPGRGRDGTMNGPPQPTGAFVWNCRFRLSGYNEDNKNGTVVLIK